MKTANSGHDFWPNFWRGFRAVLPFWLAAIPFAIAYAVAAQKAGLSTFEILLMSVTIYSGAAQLAIVQLLSTGAGFLTLVVTAVALSLHHILYALALARQLELSRVERAVLAYFLTDSAYGLSMAQGSALSFAYVFGAAFSMYTVWVVCTIIGVGIGQVVAIPAAAQLSFVVPLTFFLLVVSSLKTRIDVLVSLFSMGAALIGMTMLGSGSVFIVGLLGALVGAVITRKGKGGKIPMQPAPAVPVSEFGEGQSVD